MYGLVALLLMLASPAWSATRDSGVDTGSLAETTDTGDAQEAPTPGTTGGTTGGTVVDTSSWSGGYSAADLAGERGGNSWDGACGEGSQSVLLVIGLLALARRRD